MESEKVQEKVAEGGADEPPTVSKEQSILQMQQENEGSDEEYLSENEEIIDSNDASNLTSALDLNLNEAGQHVWLVRLPRFLVEKWKQKEFYQGQDLGRIKIKRDSKLADIKLELNDDETTRDIPHNYEVNMQRSAVENQYVFTEQNLENFKKNENKDGNENGDNKNDAKKEEDSDEDIIKTPAAQPITDSATNTATKSNGQGAPSGKPELKPLTKREAAYLRRRRRFNRYKNQDGTDKVIPFVKTIPKKTALTGTIDHECQINPLITDPNYSKIIARRKNLVKEEPRPSVTLLNEIPGVTLSNAGLTLKTDTSKFLKSSTSTKNKGEGRAIRMPQKDLFDLLFKLFDEYDYWSLKGLKERTKQPEVYLKETLEQIAQLIKKGPYALKYALKREFKELKDQERAERLGELSKENEDEDDDEDNDEDVEMEDVNM